MRKASPRGLFQEVKETQTPMSRRVIPRLVFLIPVLWMGACDSVGPDGPRGPGTFEGTLYSPNGAEGSAVLELTGGIGLGTVSPIGGEVLYQHSAESTRIIVVLDEPGEVRFLVRTENVGELPVVRVVQVADGANELRSSLGDYSVSFTQEKDSSKKGGGG
jgi:hypothetical protein